MQHVHVGASWGLSRRGVLGSCVAMLWSARALAQASPPGPSRSPGPQVPPRPLLPPLLAKPTSDRFVGKMVFAQLISPDISAAEAFYGSLFGWSFEDYRLGQTAYSVASVGGRRIAGLLQRPLPPNGQRQPAWLSFFSAANLDQTVTVASQNGAAVLFAPTDVPDLGREAVLSDPQGAVFAMLASSSGDPPDTLPPQGAWIWASLIANDSDRDAAFYQAVFGYQVFDLPGREDAQHLLLSSGDYARASINPMPGRGPDVRPYWLDFVRVDDADEIAGRVPSLGGRVLVAPRVDRNGGKIAVMADAQGAPFGVLEWSDEEPPQ